MTASRELFERHPSVRGSFHASCEEGWLPLIDDCLTQLESIEAPIEIRGIKEKMGVLQISIVTPPSISEEDARRWEDIIRDAE